MPDSQVESRQHQVTANLKKLDAASAGAAVAEALKTRTTSEQTLFDASVQANLNGLKGPGREVTDLLWSIVVPAMVVLVLGSAFYTIQFLREDRSTDVVITIFTTSFAFLAGLFARPPGTGSNNS